MLLLFVAVHLISLSFVNGGEQSSISSPATIGDKGVVGGVGAGGTSAESSLKSFLNKFTSALSGQQCYDPTWSTTAEEYVNDKWKDMIPEDAPALVYPFCADANSFGNTMGMLFNEASCAKVSGSHFIMNRKPYPDFERSVYTNGNPAAFFDALPTIVMNTDPWNKTMVKQALNASNNCGCRHYCWERAAVDSAPWVKNVQWIIQVLRSALDRFVPSDAIATTVLIFLFC